MSCERLRPVGISRRQGYYRHRRKVENCFCRLKRFRRIATRYEKLADTFSAFLHFAVALDWLTYEV